MLSTPSLYLYEFIEIIRDAYYDALTRARQSNDLIHWIRFFLNGVAETATKARDTFRQILALRTEVDGKLLTLGKRAHNAQRALQVLYRRPVLSASTLEQELGVSQPTVSALLRDFERLGILKEVTGSARYRLFSFESYIDLYLR
jgi:Fic family protein